MKKRIKRLINQVPAGYYQNLNLFQKWWHGGKFKAVKKLIASGKFKKMLDLGCNDGVMTARIVSLFPGLELAVGVDLFNSAIDFARKKHPNIKFEVGDVQRLRFKEKFDLITCFETIEHVEQPGRLISEVKRLLKDDGVAIIEMDSGNWLFKLVWFVWTRGRGRVWRGAHLWQTDKNKLLNLLKISGLKIEKIISFNFGMGVAFKLKNKK